MANLHLPPPPTPEHLLAYCERAGDAGLWAEPLNFITNAAFLVFGLLAWRFLQRQPQHHFRVMGDLWLLAASMFLIGIGSGLWHSWAAAGWTVMVDTIPIYLFINIYIISLYRRIARWSWLRIALLWAGFTGISAIIQSSLPMDTLNGSLMYLPTLAFMWLSGLYFTRQGNKGAGQSMLVLGALFLLSLAFRTFDSALCETIPIGTHFIWHLLNALLLYKLLLLLTRKPTLS